MTNEIAELPPQETALAIYSKPEGLEPWLEKIRSEVYGHVPDLKTKKGRDQIASLAFKVRKSKSALDALGKQLVDDLKEAPKKVDAERKRMRDTLDALADEVHFPLTEWEEAEAKRVHHHELAICSLQELGSDCTTADEYRAAIAELEAIKIDDSWEEFAVNAAKAKDANLTGIRELLAKRVAYEAEQAELAKLRADAEARSKADHEAAIAAAAVAKAQAEEKERAEAAERKAKQAIADAEAAANAERMAAEKREADLKLAAEQAENRRLQQERQAEQDKKDAAEKAERDRQQAIENERKRQAAAEQAEREETERRERNKAHVGKINRAALAALMESGIDEETGKQIIKLIATGKVPNVVINY